MQASHASGYRSASCRALTQGLPQQLLRCCIATDMAPFDHQIPVQPPRDSSAHTSGNSGSSSASNRRRWHLAPKQQREGACASSAAQSRAALLAEIANRTSSLQDLESVIISSARFFDQGHVTASIARLADLGQADSSRAGAGASRSPVRLQEWQQMQELLAHLCAALLR